MRSPRSARPSRAKLDSPDAAKDAVGLRPSKCRPSPTAEAPESIATTSSPIERFCSCQHVRMDMPRDTTRQKTGRQAVSIAQLWFERNGFIFRRGDGDTDFGIDAELEFSDDMTTGLLIKCQIKGSTHVRFTAKGIVRVRRIATSTRNQWTALRIPVVALLIDIQTGRIYWTMPQKVFDPDSTDLIFRRADCANDAPNDMRAALWQAAQTPPAPDTLDSVIGFLQIFETLRREVGWEYPGRHLDREHQRALYLRLVVDGRRQMTLRLVYDHVLRLRLLLGVTSPAMWPFSWWQARNNRIAADLFGDRGQTFLDTVAGEMMEYLTPFYREALDRVREVARYKSVRVNLPEVASLSEMLDGELLDAFFRRDEQGRWPEPAFQHGIGPTYDEAPLVPDSTLSAMDVSLAEMSVRYFRPSDVAHVKKCRREPR